MYETIMKSVTVGIMENLDPKKHDEFIKVMENAEKKPKKLKKFLKKEIPNYEDIVEKEIAKYKKFIITGMKK